MEDYMGISNSTIIRRIH
ncbi:hypothetical protein Godav_004436 [Gossypium davidsonii]|uniref:Uncharacterized protein n=2 Tax=Gossypium TaxID=3633 RepID=A0A7J8SM06_GOSDV|nr:hypothetical protein [Gossypium lobatum]MBA0626850.1 hypothetical protein [Gossypium davidsonii]